MKRKILIFSVLMMMTAVFVIDSCKKNPAALDLGTLMVGSIDLNAAIAPTNVPVNPTITATFTTEVNASTAIASNITLTEDYDDVSIPLTITASGKVVTITPNANLANGALYTLAITAGLKATDGQPVTALNRSFTTVGSFLPAGMVAYWNFDGNANDQTGDYSPLAAGVIDVTYVTGRNAASGQAASFNGTTSLIEIPNGDVLELTSDFSISFWMKCDTVGKHDQWVFGLSAWEGFQFEYNCNYGTNGTQAQYGWCKLAAQYSLSSGGSQSQDLWYDGSGTTKDFNNGWKGYVYSKDLTTSGGVDGLLGEQWAHVVCTYDHASMLATMYINGVKMFQQDYNLYGDPMDLATGLVWAGATGNNSLAFGYIQDKNNPSITGDWIDYSVTTNPHFKGLLDDVAIYHSVLTQALITLMYNSGKP